MTPDPVMQLITGIVMLAGGVAGLVKARAQHARYRIIRSIAPGVGPANAGLVRIRGRARTENALASPLTGTLCCHYRVVVEEDRDYAISSGDSSGREGPSWHQIWTEESKEGFSIDGAAGGAAVRPEGLELDVKPVLEREIYSGPKKEPGDDALLEYLQRKSPAPFRNFLWEKTTSALLSKEAAASPEMQEKLRLGRERLGRKLQRDVKHHNYRFREYCIVAGEEYEMVATAGPLHGGGRVLMKDAANGLFLISTGSSGEIERRQLRLFWSFAGWGAGIGLFGLLLLIFR
ncbi:MAG TPA: hypothetical protein VN893_20875 [Bryobacteraceae bacterium]|nr:hypothetical protein [Bryobacteraceae bacterium]